MVYKGVNILTDRLKDTLVLKAKAMVKRMYKYVPVEWL